MKIAVITCGALAAEVKAIATARGWDVSVFALPAILHNEPRKIPAKVLASISELRDRFDRIVVAYADCGTGGELDQVLAPLGIPRISGPHCFETYGRRQFDELMKEEPGTFFLTDFLVKAFDTLVIGELGLARFPELRSEYFRNYKRIVYFAQNLTPELGLKAKEVAEYLGLPLVIKEVGWGALEPELVELVEPHAN